jgi:DNA-binding NarL/FixJ family response regulator
MNNANFKNVSAIILDDHKLFADSFAKLVEFTTLFKSVNVYYNDQDLIQSLIRFRSKDPIFLFVDYYLGEKSLPLFINDLRRVSKGIKIIVVSSLANPYLLQDLQKYSPDGILSKTATADELFDCIHEIFSGSTFVSPSVKSIMDSAEDDAGVPFTNREIELLQYFAKGLSINGAAEELNLSKHTIAAHRRKMMLKTNTSSITALLAEAKRLGVI